MNFTFESDSNIQLFCKVTVKIISSQFCVLVSHSFNEGNLLG